MRTQTHIQKQYGGRGRNAVNRAIRAEIPGGAELLDAIKSLDDLLTMTRQGATACFRTHHQAKIVLKMLSLSRDAMAKQVMGD